jgi:metal-sulfur cluster biosynthetic enzyme
MTALSHEDVISRLHEVIDPCSAATKVPLSIVEMGMVESVEIASGNVVVALRMTSPLCHALPYFEMEIERALTGLPGFTDVKCTFDHGGNWEPDNMTAGAKRKLADHREFVRNRAAEQAHKSYPTLKPVEVFKSVKTA